MGAFAIFIACTVAKRRYSKILADPNLRTSHVKCIACLSHTIRINTFTNNLSNIIRSFISRRPGIDSLIPSKKIPRFFSHAPRNSIGKTTGCI